MKKLLKVLTAFCTTVIVAGGSLVFSACGTLIGGQGFSYELDREYLQITYSGSESREYDLPAVISDDLDENGNPRYTVDWYIDSMKTDSGARTAFRTASGKYEDQNGNPATFSCAIVRSPNAEKAWRFSLRPLPDEGDTWATIIFVANINGSKKRVQQPFEVRMRDAGEAEFETLYSFRHENLEPYESGLGARRVFGLYDLVPGGTTKDDVKKSGDIIDLAWRYKKQIALRILLLENKTDPDDAALHTLDHDAENLVITDDEIMDVRALLNGEGIPSTIKIDFKSVGIRALRIIGTSVFDDDDQPVFYDDDDQPVYTATFEYIYDVRGAVNCYTFEDIKRVEKEARLDYIRNGVNCKEDKSCTDPAHNHIGPIADAQVAGYYSASLAAAYPKMLSRQFLTTEVNRLGQPYMKVGGKAVGAIFNEFERWNPSYRYKDIVIRSDMKTWAEGTWFFGNVYGNGYILDATPYAQNAERRYRNVHGNFWEIAHEGEIFRDGFGWGDKFAFYMLANNSTIDNITLVGDNIVKAGGIDPLLNEYKTISVIGTSHLDGGVWGYHQGEAWGGPTVKFRENLYVKNIRVQNCVIEKGLTLVGAAYAPHKDYPVVVESCILRYAGFAGIYGRGQDNSIEQRNNRASGPGSEVQQYSDIGRVMKKQYDSNKTTVINSNISLSCGNFVVSKNNIFYDICTSAMLGNDDWSGTHYLVLGTRNYYYTWVDSLKLVFPIMKVPNGMDKLNITKIATGVLSDLMRDPIYNDTKLSVPGEAGYYINLPFISVDTFHDWTVQPNGRKSYIVANVIDFTDEVFAMAGGETINKYCVPVTTSVEAGDDKTVFAFTVVLLKNTPVMKTGT
jgi:hypothetical protein